ncbi:MAG: transglutaminase domain-containing protein [Deltaproteobacteria bacterium]|nr:transglutaminase domain-containing protein [Deltaproteobacteria bacterium]
MKRILLLIVFFILFATISSWAENYTVQGNMVSQIRFEIQKNVTTVPGVQKTILSFVVPPTFQSPTFNQDIKDFDITFTPRPTNKDRSTDDRGNQIITATWEEPPRSIDVRLAFNAANTTKLKTLETGAPFPLAAVPDEVKYYLKPTEQVQSENAQIINKARELTQGVTTEFDAVQRTVSWVVDHVRYVTPPKRYDALYTFESGKGNCQNFSHLSAALLRAVGIPARIVNGITLNKPFNISRQSGVLTVKMGQGRHSWIEVWFPDLGWIPLDAQQTSMFVANRFIRVEVGIDNNETIKDGRLRWTQTRSTTGKLKSYEVIGADFDTDSVKVNGNRELYGPKNLLISPLVKAEFKKVKYTPPPPPPVISDEEKKKLRFTIPFIFGNLEFPENIDFAFPPTPTVAMGEKSFEKTRDFYVETAEYVTTKLIQYAQVFVLAKPIKLQKLGLALHKFGGDGQLWIDLYKDNKGKPGDILSASEMIDLQQLSLRPGYRWVDFDFSRRNVILMPGSYWIGLGYTGSPILNWFYTYGKPVGPVDGTRYKGVYEEDWSGALSYEFNYRVVGLTVRTIARSE